MSARPPGFAPAETLASLAGWLRDADSLGPEDVRALRRLVYVADVVSREAALGPGAPREWRQFLNGALSDHLVNQVRPAGYITGLDAGG